jgi:anti-sigma factor RsiW
LPANCNCLDDDTLSAYVEGSLLAAHRAVVDEHVDRCGRCRRLLAAVGASDDAPETPRGDRPREE